MDWVTGAITVLGMELVAKKRWYGWLVSLVNQVLWIYLIVDKKLWGLAPLTAILCFRYTTFLIRWRREQLVLVDRP